MSTQTEGYAIQGGAEGKARLNLLAEVLQEHTRALLLKAGVHPGNRFLDLGCGGGNVSRLASELVGPQGSVTAVDFDEDIIELNQQELIDLHTNITYRALSAYDLDFEQDFDVAYARFLLSHLADPLSVLNKMLTSLRPGGRLIVEDVDFSGHFCYPRNEAFEAYLHYYAAVVRQKGADPNLGQRLFSLCQLAGLRHAGVEIIQPVFSKGAGKWMAWITMDRIKPAILHHGLADEQKVNEILQDLDAFTKDDTTLLSMPRIVRVWGIK